VAGALFSGFAMVLTLAIPLRHYFHLHDFITMRHLTLAAKVVLACSMIVAYGYASEIFTAYYSGDEFEIAMTVDRFTGAYSPIYWAYMVCNVAVPQLLWFARIRRCVPALLIISLLINIGMWMERFLIVVQSLHQDFLPSSWGLFVPTFWDWTFLLGSIALFIWLFLMFVRFLPVISMTEMRGLIHETASEARS
jgi:molybdopterin-containing oxidoreductase family membrane subunit